MKKILLCFCALLAVSAAAAFKDDVRQLTAAEVARRTLPDGRVAVVENLGNPLPGKHSGVEFVSVLPNGDKIAWAVTVATIEHFLIGYSEQSGLYQLDLSKYFGPHSYKPTIAFHGESIYLLAGNRGPALIRYHIPTRQAAVLKKYDIPYYYLGYARDSAGRIFWGTYPNTEVIGVDPRTDEVLHLGRMTEEKGQSYALLPAVDENDILYVPVGMSRPELYAYNLKTGEKKQILSPENIRQMRSKRQNIIRIVYLNGSVYGDVGGKVMRCTPGGMEPVTGSVGFRRNEYHRNMRSPSADFGSGRTALRFNENGLIVLENGLEKLIPIDGLPLVGQEIYSLGCVRDGKLFGSGIFPANTFSVDLNTLTAKDYGMVSGGGVQNYDLGDAPGGVLLASYTGGYLDLLDPDAPLKKGVNPTRIGNMVNFMQERPFRLTQGEAPGIFYVGTMPVKNAYSGAVVRVDTARKSVTAWEKVIENHSIMEVMLLNDDASLLFGMTNIYGGSGTEPIAKNAELFILDTRSGKVIWRDAPLPDIVLYQGAARTPDGKIFFIARKKQGKIWCLWDPETRKIIRTMEISSRGSSWSYTARDASEDGRLYFMSESAVYEYAPGSDLPQKILAHPSMRHTGYIKFAPDGMLYFFDECRLMRLRLIQPSK